MRARLAFAFLLALAESAGAQLLPQSPPGSLQQAPVGLPTQSFAYFKCFCLTTLGAPLPNQLSFAPPPARQWNGSVYATSPREAVSKAQFSCTAERRGSLFDCVNCRCDR